MTIEEKIQRCTKKFKKYEQEALKLDSALATSWTNCFYYLGKKHGLIEANGGTKHQVQKETSN